MKALRNIALIGNPNTGKSSLFNALTGLNQKVGNFPGVTVDKLSGEFKLDDATKIRVIDLPGTYSLHARSQDEQIAVQVLSSANNPDYPEVIVVVADATNLKRNLLLFTQVLDLGIPTVLALNMMDQAKAQEIHIDVENLSNDIGIPVVGISARNNEGIQELKQAIAQQLEARKIVSTGIEFNPDKAQASETIARYNWINELLFDSVYKAFDPVQENYSNKIDKWLTHRVWGLIIFFCILFLVFQSIFTWSTFPMDMIELAFVHAEDYLRGILSPGIFTDLLVGGILPGLSGVLVFIPQIAILFLFIAILEDTGYMARVTFMMDRLMKKFGLNGKSVVPLMSGIACAVPAIMSTRTIENWKDRLITIMVTPLMSCSARLPVYTLLIALVVPSEKVLGIFNLQGLVLMGMYLIGFVAAILSAYVMKLIIKTKERSFFIMELPVYRMPRWGSVGIIIYNKVKTFVFEAGKVILAVSIVLWLLASYGPSESMQYIDQKYEQSLRMTNANIDSLERLKSSEKLEASYAGQLGKLIEPAIRPLGYDWKIGIALITSFAAREVFVGTMATIYSVEGGEEEIETVKAKLSAAVNPNTGQPTFNLATSFSLMLFYAFAMQCMSTIAVVYRETKSWKWPLIQLFYMTALAYVSAFVVYTLLA